jgi:hypothetical protein
MLEFLPAYSAFERPVMRMDDEMFLYVLVGSETLPLSRFGTFDGLAVLSSQVILKHRAIRLTLAAFRAKYPGAFTLPGFPMSFQSQFAPQTLPAVARICTSVGCDGMLRWR